MTICVVITTTNDEAKATEIASKLVENKLAACVQIEEIRSIYSWDNNLQNDKEYRLFIKTCKKLYYELANFLKHIHNYDVPQIIKIDIDAANEEYINWMVKNVK